MSMFVQREPSCPMPGPPFQGPWRALCVALLYPPNTALSVPIMKDRNCLHFAQALAWASRRYLPNVSTDKLRI